MKEINAPLQEQKIIQILDIKQILSYSPIPCQKYNYSLESKSDYFDSQISIEREYLIIKNKIKGKWYKSKASCKLSSITGFVFGGTSSRFWMMRK